MTNGSRSPRDIALSRVVTTAKHLVGEDDLRISSELSRKETDATNENVLELDDMGTRWLPIFVCNLLFPGCKFEYVMFEPRYLLLIQDVLKGSGEFGVCLSADAFPKDADDTRDFLGSHAKAMGYCEYGCLVKIQNHRTLPDGRIIVQVSAMERFRVTDVSVHSGKFALNSDAINLRR